MEQITIIRHLLQNPDYLKKVLPHLKAEYFTNHAEAEIYRIVEGYVGKYGNAPTKEIIDVEFEKRKLTQMDYDHGKQVLAEVSNHYKAPDMKWLMDTTEQFCLQQSVIIAINRSLEIIDGGSETEPLTALPELMRNALNVNFDTEVGHDYLENVEDRYKKLREQTERLTFDIDNLNKIFGGGVPRKTLSLFVGGTGSGKSLIKSHCASHFYQKGYNVLYVTLELAEERIGERFDANLFDMAIDDIYMMPLEQYKRKLNLVNEKAKGARIFIKEFPPASITTAHLRSLLDELRNKKNFVPDVVVVDYINLMNSSRYKPSQNANSYTILKAVAEELRALAVERNIAIISSTQTTRDGNGASDLSLTNISESMGLGHTADAIIGIIRTEELDQLGQLILKCLKTRFSDKTNFRFLVGVTLGKMKLTNVGEGQGQYVAQPGYTAQQAAPAKPDVPLNNFGKRERRDVSAISG